MCIISCSVKRSWYFGEYSEYTGEYSEYSEYIFRWIFGEYTGEKIGILERELCARVMDVDTRRSFESQATWWPSSPAALPDATVNLGLSTLRLPPCYKGKNRGQSERYQMEYMFESSWRVTRFLSADADDGAAVLGGSGSLGDCDSIARASLGVWVSQRATVTKQSRAAIDCYGSQRRLSQWTMDVRVQRTH